MIIETSQMLASSLFNNQIESPIKEFNPKHVNLSRTNNHCSYWNSRLLLDIGKNVLNTLKFTNEEFTLPHLAFTKESEDLKIKYGSKNENYYIANTIEDAVIAY